jgi:hypothetical protein
MDLEARVALLEDEREILRTMYQYGHSNDYGPLDEFLDCFTEDGAWERRRRDVPGQSSAPTVYEGREGLTRFFNSHRRAPDIYYKHLVVEPRITLRGDEAEVLSYFVKVDEHPDGPYIYAFGRYRDRLVRCPDGRWRFRRRLAETEDVKVKPWTAEHDHGARVTT